MHIASPIGIHRDGYLQVRSTQPKEEYNPGGRMYGYRYEWGVNHHSFTKDPKETMERFGLTQAEYDHWEPLITF